MQQLLETMSREEEHACLVRTRSDSENSARNLAGFGSMEAGAIMSESNGGTAGRGNEGIEATDAAELMDYRDMSVLAQFHEDAITQAGCGRHQLSVCGLLGLAVAACGVEYVVVPYIRPSADVEYCITTSQNWWLFSITLLGISCGGIFWGSLADRAGRRRILLSCLGVNAVFSVIAAFMPTYGPFMMARFCSAVGIGGVLICTVSLLAEISCGAAARARSIAFLMCFIGLGQLACTGVVPLILPLSGHHTVLENKAHFSAWHRYLLLCATPTLVSLFSILLWGHESPRYLLESGREVEALTIYQRIYKKNHSKSASSAAGAAGGSGYQLSELELPSKRPLHCTPPTPPAPSVLADMIGSVQQFWNSLAQLWSTPLSGSTCVILSVLLVMFFGWFAIYTYSPSLLIMYKNTHYLASAEHVPSTVYDRVVFNTPIENKVYENSTFKNCSFANMTFSHVIFKSCSFIDVDFFKIMSSFLVFEGCYFENSTFIDTDLNTARHMDKACRLLNSTVMGLTPRCPIEADYNIYLIEIITVGAASAGALIIASLLAILFLPIIGRVPLTVGSLVFATLSTPALFFLESQTSIVVYCSIFLGLLFLAYVSITVIIVETYPVHLRCTAHGFMMSACHLAALIGVSIYSSFTIHSYILVMLMTCFISILGVIFSTRLIDTSSTLI